VQEQARKKHRTNPVALILGPAVISDAKCDQAKKAPVVMYRDEKPGPPHRETIAYRQLGNRVSLALPNRSVHDNRMILKIGYQRIALPEK
jgi:hypothetical protein